MLFLNCFYIYILKSLYLDSKLLFKHVLLKTYKERDSLMFFFICFFLISFFTIFYLTIYFIYSFTLILKINYAFI